MVQFDEATMSTRRRSPTSSVAELAGDAVGHAMRLIRQQMQLLKSEVGEDVGEAGAATAAMGGGIALLAASGVLTTVAGVHLLQRITRWPLWSCYGVAAVSAAVFGRQLFVIGRDQAGRLLKTGLSQTAAELRENADWVRDQLTAK
jgi:hypothetical protein